MNLLFVWLMRPCFQDIDVLWDAKSAKVSRDFGRD